MTWSYGPVLCINCGHSIALCVYKEEHMPRKCLKCEEYSVLPANEVLPKGDDNG